MELKKFKHWRCELDDNKILWVIIDRAGKAVNTMSREVMTEFNDVIDLIEQQKDIIGVALKNGKEVGFIAGADISEFTNLTSPEESKELMHVSQNALVRLENLSVPTVVLIDGFALGGGYEICLACTYRVALDSPKVKIGLPETLLGIHPGWAGSVRLARLIGGLNALKLMVPGKSLGAYQAKKAGLIDDVARSKTMLDRAAIYYLTKKPQPHRPGFIARLSNMKLFRPFIAKQVRKQTSQKINPLQYPAPFALIDNWEKYGVDLMTGQEGEINSVANLFIHPTARELVRIFFLREKMKALGKKAKFDVQHVHVVGAGTMGGDIAAFCALNGLRVTLQDREEKYIAPAIKRANKLFKKRCKTRLEIQRAMDRLIPDAQGDGVINADVIIEAIYENLEAKQTLFKSVESRMKPTALLATNTSTIPLEEINQVLTRPEKLVGVHFFNPVPMMQLVEVVHGQNTAEEEISKALSFVTKLGKSPISVKSGRGFLVNRILFPYMSEAFILADEGVSLSAIDKAAVDFGFPMGPIELADIVGLDVIVSAGKTSSNKSDQEAPKKIQELVALGNLGKKTGSGFYTYRNDKPVKSDSSGNIKVPSDITDRLILRMVNEAVDCMNEKVIDDRDLLDAGMIFGIGFPPFRGGPMQYMQNEGAENVFARLENLEKNYGERFTPSKGWKKFITAKANKE